VQTARSIEVLGAEEIVAQQVEDAPAAGLPVRPIGPELVEEEAVLDVRQAAR
jgi:hypothetical protein